MIKLKMKRLFQHVVISLAIRLETVKWMAFAILAALGVVRETQLEREDVFLEVNNWLRWLSQAGRTEECKIGRILATKSNLGMVLMVRGP